MGFLEKRQNLVAAAVRFALGWHLAYMGVWALTSEWAYSWAGCFRCAHWIFGGFFRAVGNSAAMGGVDLAIAWGLLVAGILLMLGRATRPAALFGIFYLALMYVLNPPHFGHTGESHFLYVDRNVVEIVMFVCVMAWSGKKEEAAAEETKEGADREVAK